MEPDPDQATAPVTRQPQRRGQLRIDRPQIDRPQVDRRRAERDGGRAETIAAMWLRLKGYRILHRRYRGFGGEIDIVARRGRLVAVVEVKARRTAADCLAAVTLRQQRRVEAAAAELIARDARAAGCSVRFDVIAVRPRRLPLHLIDAWRPAPERTR